MKDFIKWLLDEKYKAFFGGAIAGIAPGAIFLLDVPTVSGFLLAWVYFLKVLGAVIIAFASGLAAALASDAYKAMKKSTFISRIKTRFFNRKSQKDGRQRQKRA